MSWDIRWASHARRDLRGLPGASAARIVRAVTQFAESERGDLRKLEGSDEEWALRVGEWRVRFICDRERNAVHILRVLQRRDAYRR